MTPNSIVVFTDGSSRGNPGPGGFGVVVVFDDKVVELGGREDYTTNNRMEIRAAIKALSFVSKVKGQMSTVLYTDSAYLLNGITKWVFGWQKNNWKTSTKQSVENQDLWQELLEIIKGKKINWRLVKGHVGVAGNQRCDEIATAFAGNNPPKLYSDVLKNYRIKDILNISSNLKAVDNYQDAKKRSRAKPFSYVSTINGKVKIYQTWSGCEKRVKGQSGARFKKVFSKSEEDNLVREWSN